MKANFFGEFLVHKGLIKQDVLVTSLIEQVAAQPPVCKIVFDNKLMTPEQILSVFNLQQERNCDFREASKDLGLWSLQIEQKIQKVLGELRLPLGQILVNSGAIDLKGLTHMLDEFLSQAEVFTPAPVTSVKKEDPSFEEAIKAVLEQNSPSAEISELKDMFDERKRKVVKVALSFIKDKNPPDKGVVLKLFRDSLKVIHTINGLLVLLKMDKTSRILELTEDILNGHLGREDATGEDKMIAELVSRGFEESWNLRCYILESGTEDAYFEILENKVAYDSIIRDLEAFKGWVC